MYGAKCRKATASSFVPVSCPIEQLLRLPTVVQGGDIGDIDVAVGGDPLHLAPASFLPKLGNDARNVHLAVAGFLSVSLPRASSRRQRASCSPSCCASLTTCSGVKPSALARSSTCFHTSGSSATVFLACVFPLGDYRSTMPGHVRPMRRASLGRAAV